MRIHGIGVNLVDMRAYTGLTWAPMLLDARATLQTLNNPWPLHLPVGRLLLYDDLEGVLKWSQLSGTVSKDSTIHVSNGDYCLKLLTGAVAGNEAASMRVCPLLDTSRLRFMVHWHAWGGDAAPAFQYPRYVRFRLDIYDGAKMYQPQLEYLNYLNTVKQEKWRYNNAAGNFADVPGGAQHLHMGGNDEVYPADNFLLMDAEIAAGACTIKRILSNTLDLKGLSLSAYVEDNTHAPGIDINLLTVTDVAQAVAAYFDDVAMGDKALPDLV